MNSYSCPANRALTGCFWQMAKAILWSEFGRWPTVIIHTVTTGHAVYMYCMIPLGLASNGISL